VGLARKESAVAPGARSSAPRQGSTGGAGLATYSAPMPSMSRRARVGSKGAGAVLTFAIVNAMSRGSLPSTAAGAPQSWGFGSAGQPSVLGRVTANSRIGQGIGTLPVTEKRAGHTPGKGRQPAANQPANRVLAADPTDVVTASRRSRPSRTSA